MAAPLTLHLQPLDWLNLFLYYLSLSLLAVGGAIATAPDMHRFLVERQGWLTEVQFNTSIVIAQSAPGPNVLFIALLGWNVGLNAAGTGMLVLGLASIIIGETFIGKRGMLRHLIAVAVGAVLYRMLLTVAFQIGLPAADLKLFSASIVIIAIAVPVIKDEVVKRRRRHAGN